MSSKIYFVYTLVCLLVFRRSDLLVCFRVSPTLTCGICAFFFSFRYVLTRGLNSDPVESLFSCLRQFNGGNDKVDARTAVYTVEKLLKVLFKTSPVITLSNINAFFQVGILQAAKSGNAPASSEMKAPIRLAVQNVGAYPLPAPVVLATRELASEI